MVFARLAERIPTPRTSCLVTLDHVVARPAAEGCHTARTARDQPRLRQRRKAPCDSAPSRVQAEKPDAGNEDLGFCQVGEGSARLHRQGQDWQGVRRCGATEAQDLWTWLR